MMGQEDRTGMSSRRSRSRSRDRDEVSHNSNNMMGGNSMGGGGIRGVGGIGGVVVDRLGGGIGNVGGGGIGGIPNPNPMASMNVAANAAIMNPLLSAQQAAQDKINRELFVGNTPPGTSEMLLLQFLNGALRRVQLCQSHETPILNCRVNTKFAFIELVNSEMANRALNLNGIPFLGAVLKVSRPSKYSGPPVVSKTWQELTGQTLPQGIALDAEQEKVNRELFIGNTTPEMTEQMLKDFLGNAMEQVGLNVLPGNPITACRVSGKFAFIELRSPQEAANALNLNNIPFLGTQLRVGRPSKWNGPPDTHGNWEDILAKYMSGELQLPSQQQQQQQQQPPIDNANNTNNNNGANPYENQQQQQTNNTVTDYNASAAGSIQNDASSNVVAPPSRVVELKNMLTADDLLNDEEYNDILEDTREECSQFGQLLQVIIPKANEVGATKIFLEYTSQQDAQKAIEKLAGRTFDGRKVQANYYDEALFSKKQY